MADDSGAGLVQLGHLEVHPDVLSGPGVSLDEIVATAARENPTWVIDEHSVAKSRELFPAHGWRTIGTRRAGDSPYQTVIFAAPSDQTPGAWVLATLSEQEGRWQLTLAARRPCVPLPGRAARRRDLRLTWPESPIVAPAGEVPELTVTVTNTSARSWQGAPGDLAIVVAWLSDLGTGETLAPSGWFAYGAGAPAELAAGESRRLTPTMGTADVDRLAPGEYGVEAKLVALDLSSGRHRLRLV